ncbi:MAG: hypothetical protein WCQ91_02595 [Planctomycetota bacterium]
MLTLRANQATDGLTSTFNPAEVFYSTHSTSSNATAMRCSQM